MFRRIFSASCGAGMLASLLPAPWISAAAAQTLSGKTVTIYVAGGVGGGVDAYARTLTPYLSQHLPGNPSVTISNMPGAGGAQALQYLYNVSARDGTAIGMANAGPIAQPFLERVKAQYELNRFQWVGSLTKGNTVCAVWHTSPVKAFDDLKTRAVTIGTTGATSAPNRTALLMNALLKTTFKPVAGYKGQGETLLAMERNEVEATCLTLNALRTSQPQWITEQKVRIILNVAFDNDPEFPNLPRAIDQIKDPTDKAALEFFLLPYEFNNPFMLPPATPSDVVSMWRSAFAAAIADPAYRADAAKRQQDLSPKSGEEVAALVGKLYATPESVVKRTLDAISPGK